MSNITKEDVLKKVYELGYPYEDDYQNTLYGCDNTQPISFESFNEWLKKRKIELVVKPYMNTDKFRYMVNATISRLSPGKYDTEEEAMNGGVLAACSLIHHSNRVNKDYDIKISKHDAMWLNKLGFPQGRSEEFYVQEDENDEVFKGVPREKFKETYDCVSVELAKMWLEREHKMFINTLMMCKERFVPIVINKDNMTIKPNYLPLFSNRRDALCYAIAIACENINAPKFKVSDKVKINYPMGYEGEDNSVGEIVSVNSHSQFNTYIVETIYRKSEIPEFGLELID